MRILGVDPGSRLTGFGCVDLVGNQLVHVAHGTLRLSNTGGKAVIPLERRLLLVYEGLSEVILKHKPKVLAVEKVFFAKNAVSALKLGQARGAVILTGMIHGLKIVEYSPSEVKLTVVGHGAADKNQVAKMVALMTGAKDFATSDASDGLALAICHALVSRTAAPARTAEALEALRSSQGRRTKKRMTMAEAVAHHRTAGRAKE
jgi:crossover junction endodeoxyribonuclease RuvC